MSKFAFLVPAGFDIDTALQQLAGNEKLYLSVLTRFRTLYHNLAETIEADLQSGAFDKAQRAAHTVKGLAGTIGHSALREAAMQMERCAEPGNPAQCEAAFVEFRQALGQVLDSLENIQNL